MEDKRAWYQLWPSFLFMPTSAHKNAERISSWLSGFGLEPIFLFFVAFAVLVISAFAVDVDATFAVVRAVGAMSPIWLPIYLGVIFWIRWINYIRTMFWFKQDTVLLQIQLPQEVERSPLAMELFLATLNNIGGEGTFINRYWQGQMRPVWSLEIASTEGRVKFYIQARKMYKSIVEARIYGLFPEARVAEVDDYVLSAPYETGEYVIIGTEYQKYASPQALPIKSYIDWKLDKNEDQEYRVDPIVNVLEFMSQVGKDEHVWLQIILRGRRSDEYYGIPYAKSVRDDWGMPAKKEIEKILTEGAKRSVKLAKEINKDAKDNASPNQQQLTEVERRRIEAIERSLGKTIFECGIRSIYITKKDKFKAGNIASLFGVFGPYSGDFNGLMLTITRGIPAFNYPWQDWADIRRNIVRHNLYNQYKHRMYFAVPYNQDPIFLTTEELASLWHFPGTAVATPGLERVAARSAEAPLNLPIGDIDAATEAAL